jgi:hypothetical protein
VMSGLMVMPNSMALSLVLHDVRNLLSGRRRPTLQRSGSDLRPATA